MRLAHRVSYELHIGPISHGLHCLHKCDNPACVNPAHLFLGTNADNMRDRDAKGRVCRGEDHADAKLTEKQVLAIRADNRPQRMIAEGYSISLTAVNQIKKRKTWQHINHGENL